MMTVLDLSKWRQQNLHFVIPQLRQLSKKIQQKFKSKHNAPDYAMRCWHHTYTTGLRPPRPAGVKG